MSDINMVVLTGNLTRDPELRATPAGTSVLSFGLAVGGGRRNQQTGQWEERTEFVDCETFGARADPLSRIMRKGMQVTVMGRLRYSSWERDGLRRSKLSVVADNVKLPPRRAAEDAAAQAVAASLEAQGVPVCDGDPYQEEIPF